MTIYTIIKTTDPQNAPYSAETVCSCRTRGDAIRRCADHILATASANDDFRTLLFGDENHPDIPQESLESTAVRDYIVDEIGGQSGYCMYSDWIGAFNFYVDENDLIFWLTESE